MSETESKWKWGRGDVWWGRSKKKGGGTWVMGKKKRRKKKRKKKREYLWTTSSHLEISPFIHFIVYILFHKSNDIWTVLSFKILNDMTICILLDL